MPPSRGRRPKPTIQPTVKTNAAQTPTKTDSKTRTIQRPRRWLDAWKNVWAIVGPLVSLVGLAFLLWPQITINNIASLNPDDPLSAQFMITNSGHVPIYNVHVVCSLNVGEEGGLYLGDVTINSSMIAPINRISPGQGATRSCSVSSKGSKTDNIEISVGYRWPIIWRQDEKVSFFKTVRSEGGAVFLLPDLPPASTNAAMRIGGG
jgi:hypothetical protein